MATCRLPDLGLTQRLLDRALNDRLVEMVAAELAGAAIYIVPRCGEDPLPAELTAGVWVLPSERVR